MDPQNPSIPEPQLEHELIEINIVHKEETPREREIREVSEQTTSVALERLSQATDLATYMQWHRQASLDLKEESISWMWDYGGTTAVELIEDAESEKNVKAFEKDAQIISALIPNIVALEPKEGSVRIALKRVRVPDIRSYEYKVLATFPEGFKVGDPLDRGHHEREGEDTIFYDPENACVVHACDDLYKLHRDSAFYITARPVYEALSLLQSNENGNEYMLEKTEQGSVKQDAANYALVALLGGYINERNRVRVSDFWNKPQKNSSVQSITS